MSSRNKPVVILISSYGSYKTGTGHLKRDLELAKILKSYAKIFFQVDNYNEIANIFKLHNFPSSNIITIGLNKAIKLSKPSILIYDKPYSRGKIPALNNNMVKILGLDYFYYQDKRINLSINLINHYISNYKIQNNLNGFKYAIIKKEILDIRSKRIVINKEARNILITFGGSDSKENTKKILNLLKQIYSKSFNIKVIIGPLFKDISSLTRMGKSFFNKAFSYLFDTQRVGYYMNKSDIIFCGAGTTLLESLYLGKPTIVLPQSKDESNFIRNTNLENSIVMLNNNTLVKTKLLNISLLINNHRLRKRLSKQGQSLIDGKGKYRIIKIIREWINER